MLESAPGICTMDKVASTISTKAAITATIASLEREDEVSTILGIALEPSAFRFRCQSLVW
jgi:hypothetical protein